LTPDAVYTDEERDRFYLALARIGAMIAKSGVNVIFDATANKQSYRDQARKMIPRFLEVYVKCPVEVCRKRDPKGIYRMAAEGKTATVPGVQSRYEHPEHPEVLLDCSEPAGASAIAILDKLKQLLYI
jgi:adenylylsulfate kinase